MKTVRTSGLFCPTLEISLWLLEVLSVGLDFLNDGAAGAQPLARVWQPLWQTGGNKVVSCWEPTAGGCALCALGIFHIIYIWLIVLRVLYAQLFCPNSIQIFKVWIILTVAQHSKIKILIKNLLKVNDQRSFTQFPLQIIKDAWTESSRFCCNFRDGKPARLLNMLSTMMPPAVVLWKFNCKIIGFILHQGRFQEFLQ